MGRVILWSVVLLAALLTVIFSLLWLERVRMTYNSEGRYFDENALVVYQDSAVMFFGILAFVSLVLLFGTMFLLVRYKPNQNS